MDFEQPYDLEHIKQTLPLEWVVGQAAGVYLEAQGDKVHGLCPFHDDTDPSLDIYADGVRWGCFPCGLDGDLFDFIGRYWEIETFPARLERAAELLEQFGGDSTGWQAQAKAPLAATDPEAIQRHLMSALAIYTEGSKHPLAELLDQKRIEINPDWLSQQWHVGVDERMCVVAGYVNEENQIVTYKTRFPGSSGWYAAKGVPITCLYGAHQMPLVPGDRPVWLLEGETDTWLASWLLGDRGVALGLPTGAGSAPKPEWLELLRGRTVTLLFDPDPAGRRAARTWHTALTGVASSVQIAWPNGPDLVDSTDQIQTLFNRETVPPLTAGLISYSSDGHGYAPVLSDGVGKPLSNFRFTPTKEIINTDIRGKITSRGYAGHFEDDNVSDRLLRIDTATLERPDKLRAWCNAKNRSWFGTSPTHTQALVNLFQNQAPFLGVERGIEVVGLHDVGGQYAFILPNETLGSSLIAESHYYKPSNTGTADFSIYNLPAMSGSNEEFRIWAVPVIEALLNLNSPQVMSPFMAWMCAAPGRILTREWPPFGLMGGSDCGKTTVANESLLTFYGLIGEHNITSTTPFAATVWVSSTNGLPIWFDEYRKGAREDTLTTVNQILRDAWTSSSSSRGGHGTNYQDIHEWEASAPILVSGEEAFEEQSHVDRVVSVVVKKNEQRPEWLEALQQRRGQHIGRLGRKYLEWFIYELNRGNLPDVPAVADRRKQGEAVLEWGWKLFQMFCADVVGVQIGPLDLSGVKSEREQAGGHPVYEALIEAINIEAREGPSSMGGPPVAWVVPNGQVAVRVRAFHQWAVRAGYPFPGGERSTRSWIASRWGTFRSNAPWGVSRYKALLVNNAVDELAPPMEAMETTNVVPIVG